MEQEVKDIDIEKQYQEYLRLINLSEDKMGPEQKIQTKQAFYGGIARILWLLRDVIGHYSKKDQKRLTEKIWKQSELYWNQRRQQNPEKN